MRRVLMVVMPLVVAVFVFPPAAAAHDLTGGDHPSPVALVPLGVERPTPMELHALVHQHLHPVLHEHLHPVVHEHPHPLVHHLHHLVHQHLPPPGP
jgi:hypothetical protein